MAKFWQDLNTFIAQPVVSIIVKVLLAVLILIIGTKIAKAISLRFEKAKSSQRLSKTVRTFLRHIIAIALYVAVGISALLVLGFELSVFSAAIASIGVTIGLALQGGLSNIAGGIMVVAFKPFEVGDYVEAGGVDGTVTDIGIFYTTLTTPDNKRIVVPNGTISSTVVTNYSTNDTRRIDFDIEISYSASIDKARTVLLGCAKIEERIFSDPAPIVVVAEHGENGLVMKLRVWVKNDDYWDVNFAMLEEIKKQFDKFEIEIPYRQLDVHLSK